MRKSVRISFISLIVLLASRQCGAQQPESPQLPEAWLGTWVGEMTNLGRSAPSAPIDAVLVIQRDQDGTYSFRTVYNNDEERGLRDYKLVPVAGSSNDFVLDEQNGITLRARLVGGMLIAPFAVGDQRLTSQYGLTAAGTLVHQVLFWSESDVLTTTGTGPAGENGAPVDSYRLSGIQRTTFTKQP